MDNYPAYLADQLSASILKPRFSFKVTDLDGNTDWLSCDIFIERDSLIAQREGVSSEEKKSGIIANTKLAIDDCLSICEHLIALYEAVIQDIIDGDLFELSE